MDHLELLGQLPARLAALGLTALLATACVADDVEPASFGRGSTTEPPLPTTTAPSDDGDIDGDIDADIDADASPSGGAEGGDDPAGDRATATTAPLEPLQGLAVEAVADGFDQPILVTSAPGSDRLFVVEREGVIRTVGPAGVDPEPFLDLTDRLLSSSIEQGLLGLAFHPDHVDNGWFYAYWTDPEGDSVLARFTVDDPAATPPTVDRESQVTLLTIDQPAERHNAGMLAFGPDGLLYVAVGDGGSGGATAQDTSNLLGAILRLDVDGGEPYAVPADNPFGDEIWAFGLRNPWRFSIDAPSGLVYIGDVGQEAVEELNVVPLDQAGANFGWFVKEGTECFRGGCTDEGFTDPVFQYSHQEGCSITGGHVYRGAAIPEFDGHYFYADWCKGWVRSLRYDGDRVFDQFEWTDDFGLGQVTSFGTDNDGELYAVDWDGGLHRIVAVR